MEQFILNTSAVVLGLFGIIGLGDGFYYHLWKFRLYRHPETKFEHFTHTVRAILFVGILYTLFMNDFGGTVLWGGIGLVAFDVVVLIVDLFVEGNSREKLGGLPHKEYMIHVIANTLHFVSIALVLSMKPLDAFSSTSKVWLNRASFEGVAFTGELLFGGSVALAVFHVALFVPAVYKRFEAIRGKRK